MSQAPSGGRPSTDERQPSIAALRKGDRIQEAILLVEVSNFKQTRNNKNFIQMQLRDRSGSVKAVRWEADEELFASFSRDDFVRISGRVEEFQQQLQIVVDALVAVPAETVDVNDFLPASERNPDEMERELLETVGAIGDEHIKSLLLAFLEDPELRANLRRCPAGKAMHHAYTGGLLEHSLSLMACARSISSVYPELDLDVLIAAALLHDIGKLRELSYRSTFQYTDEGQLLGHIALGMTMVAEKAQKIPNFPPDLLNHLLHILASHHGIPEHGALKLPMTPEAVAFHFLDNLDAKMSTLRTLRKDLEIADAATARESKWTDFKPAFGRRFLFP